MTPAARGGQPAARSGLSGLALTGFALLVVLLAVVLAQARQFSLLRQAVQSAPEYTVMAVYQAEYEYQRLLQQWQAAVGEHRHLDERSLQLRYDIWVSRIALLHSGNVALLTRVHSEDSATLEQAQRFIARADRVLGSTDDSTRAASRLPITREFLAAELPELIAMGRDHRRAARRCRRTASRGPAVGQRHLRCGRRCGCPVGHRRRCDPHLGSGGPCAPGRGAGSPGRGLAGLIATGSTLRAITRSV